MEIQLWTIKEKYYFIRKSQNLYHLTKYSVFDYDSTADALANFVDQIHTTLMCFLSTTMFILGHRIFIINQDKKLEYEIPIDKFDRMEYELYDLLNMYRMGELIQ